MSCDEPAHPPADRARGCADDQKSSRNHLENLAPPAPLPSELRAVEREGLRPRLLRAPQRRRPTTVAWLGPLISSFMPCNPCGAATRAGRLVCCCTTSANPRNSAPPPVMTMPPGNIP